jgi:hypothetical protein
MRSQAARQHADPTPPVSGCRMLKASPSMSAPAGCSGWLVTCLFCMHRMRPCLTASSKAGRRVEGICGPPGWDTSAGVGSVCRWLCGCGTFGQAGVAGRLLVGGQAAEKNTHSQQLHAQWELRYRLQSCKPPNGAIAVPYLRCHCVQQVPLQLPAAHAGQLLTRVVHQAASLCRRWEWVQGVGLQKDEGQ